MEDALLQLDELEFNAAVTHLVNIGELTMSEAMDLSLRYSILEKLQSKPVGEEDYAKWDL